jgi:hypothetical protein
MTEYTFTIVHCEQYTTGMSHLKKKKIDIKMQQHPNISNTIWDSTHVIHATSPPIDISNVGLSKVVTMND